jgi:hypothetical protein
MRRRPLLLLAALLLVAGCRKPIPVPIVIDDGACIAGIEEIFGPQRFHVVALHPMVGEVLFTPELLQAVDRVTAELEAGAGPGVLSVKSIATVPLIKRTPTGAGMEIIREQLPVDEAGALRFREMLLSYEFAIGDTLNPASSSTFVHLPVASYTDTDVDALVDEVRAGVAQQLLVAVDGTPGADRALFREVAEDGPSADALWIVFTASGEVSIKDPAFLRSEEALQARLEAHPAVAGTYGLADDVKLARRAVHKGDRAFAVLPVKRAEVSQLLMMYEMSGNAEAYGRRVSADGAATLLRVSLRVLGAQARDEVLAAAKLWAAEGLPEGIEASVCPG